MRCPGSNFRMVSSPRSKTKCVRSVGVCWLAHPLANATRWSDRVVFFRFPPPRRVVPAHSAGIQGSQISLCGVLQQQPTVVVDGLCSPQAAGGDATSGVAACRTYLSPLKRVIGGLPTCVFRELLERF